MNVHAHYYEAAQPSAAHAWLLSRGHADCMSYSSISMLRAWSCVYTTLLSLPLSTSPLFLPLSSLSYLHHSLHAYLALMLPPFLILPSFSIKQSQIWAGSSLYYFQHPYLIFELCVCFPVLSHIPLLSPLHLSLVSLLHHVLAPLLAVLLGFWGPSGEQHARLIIPLGSSHIG